MFAYSHYTYCLQKESAHFGRKILINFGLRTFWIILETFWTQKIIQEKLTKFPIIFELY